LHRILRGDRPDNSRVEAIALPRANLETQALHNGRGAMGARRSLKFVDHAVAQAAGHYV